MRGNQFVSGKFYYEDGAFMYEKFVITKIKVRVFSVRTMHFIN